MSNALLETALSYQRAGQLDEAERLYREILRSNPKHIEALYLLGSLWFQRGSFQKALHHFEQVLQINPRLGEALSAKGAVLSSLDRHAEALSAYDGAVVVRPGQAQTWSNRGNALLALGRAEEAVQSYDRALGLMPDYPHCWRNRAAAFAALGRPDDALQSLRKAVQFAPDFADAWQDSADILVQLGRREEAVSAYDHALALRPGDPALLYGRGNALSILKRYDEAIRDCEAVLALDPDYPYVRGVLIHSKLQACDWHGLQAQVEKISGGIAAGKRVVTPFNLKALSDSPAEHLRCARNWIAHEVPPAPTPLVDATNRYRHDRIRLAYVSADFTNSAVASLMAGMFEHHDRKKFETIAVSFGPLDRVPMRIRLESAFERFVDVGGRDDGYIAAVLRSMEADIAVDLMGLTGECRTGIFARRPAPLQVNYLGFPGTMGAPYVDYIVADATVIPHEQYSHYAEKVVSLPHCYLPTDNGRAIAEGTPTREEAGLPASGFVFASFNNAYKFNPAMFDIWMRLLRAVEGSALWLPQNNAYARRNLCREAESRGVAAGRIVFAPLIADPGEHLARLSLADLFLDTTPYNAHSTCIDALSAGLPVVTRMGNSFASRAAASALKAAGLSELVTQTAGEYEALALALARDQVRLQAIRTKLTESRRTAPLFDTAAFTRDLEAAFVAMWERQQRGEPPAAFAVAPSR
jgi:predicted O-linked N-acetylglucosamine transferase (SPINDLY family)